MNRKAFLKAICRVPRPTVPPPPAKLLPVGLFLLLLQTVLLEYTAHYAAMYNAYQV